MTLEEIEKYIQRKELDVYNDDKVDVFTKKEHLKRQYLRYYQMEKKIKDKHKREKASLIKRQLMRMLGRC